MAGSHKIAADVTLSDIQPDTQPPSAALDMPSLTHLLVARLLESGSDAKPVDYVAGARALVKLCGMRAGGGVAETDPPSTAAASPSGGSVDGGDVFVSGLVEGDDSGQLPPGAAS